MMVGGIINNKGNHMNKIFLIAGLILSSCSMAYNQPINNIQVPESVKAEIMKRQAEEKRKGFYENINPYAAYLLNFKNSLDKEIRLGNKNDILDTNLKANLKNVKLAFPFELKAVNKENHLAYAVGGSYLKDKGWTGIKVFFDEPELGVCSYSYFNLKMSNGHVDISSKLVNPIVDNKESSKFVEGTPSTGFLYTVDWYTTDTMKLLDCASHDYDPEFLHKVIALANKIDKS